MIEQRNGLDFNWPKDFDPSLEKVLDFGLFTLIAKPIRLNKLERDLSALAPRSEGIQQFFQLKDVYKMRVDPLGRAGFHYHNEKIEIVFPLADVNLFCHDTKTGKSIGVKVPERAGNTCFGILIPTRVNHMIENPSATKEAFYMVLSNRYEEEALRTGDIIEAHFKLPPVQSLELLLTPLK